MNLPKNSKVELLMANWLVGWVTVGMHWVKSGEAQVIVALEG